MEKIKISEAGVKILDKKTNSLITFSSEASLTEYLMVYISRGAEYHDTDKQRFRESLISGLADLDNEISKKMVDYFSMKEADILFDPGFYERHFTLMAFSRSVDNLISYFKDILSEVVLKRPEVLSSKDQERLDFILSHRKMEDLLKAISEKKIEELFYKGIYDIEKFFKDRLGIEIFKDEFTRTLINFFVKQRNIIVHNRAKISKEFAEEFKEISNFEVGHYMSYTYEKISQINVAMNNFLVDLDVEIAEKFELDLISENSEK